MTFLLAVAWGTMSRAADAGFTTLDTPAPSGKPAPSGWSAPSGRPALSGWLTTPGGTSDAANGIITGRVRDRESGDALGWTTVVIAEYNRAMTAHEDGGFFFLHVPAGECTLKAMRIGYQPLEMHLTVHPGDSIDVTLEMTSAAFTTEGVVVEAERRNTLALARPTVEVAGAKLQLQLGRTLAETIDHEPGVAQRSMGPAPARPVMRGLSGDRLLILEDGERAGDLSATSSDHAVTIDPMNAERIEIVRGPAALMYGSNTIGGVINVARGLVPTAMPDHVHGTASLQGETVNGGLAGGAGMNVPAGPVALHTDASIRRAGDIRTAAGILRNTAIDTRGASLGASIPAAWGYAGIATSTWRSSYGIPGGFVGAHPNGVDVDMWRTHYELRAEYLPGEGTLQRLEADGSYTRYEHEEREASGIIGSRFGLLTAAGNLRLHHIAWGPFTRGSAGIWMQWRDFAADGFVSTPASVEQSLAAYTSEEFPLGDFVLQTSLRGDLSEVVPGEERLSRVIGRIRKRSFGSVSAGLSAAFDAGSGISLGIAVMRTSRAPGFEELYSEGPHLAAYAYEIGNPDLGMEHGLGVDLSARHEGARHRASITFFRTSFTGFIHPRNTGATNYRTLLPLYQFTGADATFTGAETMAEWLFAGSWRAGITASYVHGELQATRAPLPLIPPLTAKFMLDHTAGPLTIGGGVRGALPQRRTGEFEQPTAGYAVIDLQARYEHATGVLLHAIVFSAENLLDADYRSHLSRVKSVMPEPGRNIKLLYRLYF